MLAIAVLVTLAAAPVKVAVPGLNVVKLEAGEGQLYEELLAQKLRENGLEVVSARDITQVLGFERQKQLLGCEDASCIAELAGSLGADALVVGDVGKLDKLYVLNLKVLSASDGKTLSQLSTQVDEASKMPAALERAAKELVGQLAVALKRPELGVRVESRSSRPSRAWALLPAGIGLVCLGVGVVFEVQANARLNELQQAGPGSDPRSIAKSGKDAEIIGHVFLAAGITALLAAGALFLLGDDLPRPAVALTPGGAVFGLAMGLP